MTKQFSEQIQLLIERLPRPLRREGCAIRARDFVFFAEVCDQLRQALGISGRQERATLITLVVTFCEVRKILFEEGRKTAAEPGLR